jgi:outer membrane assembly lipoprotein YfiO
MRWKNWQWIAAGVVLGASVVRGQSTQASNSSAGSGLVPSTQPVQTWEYTGSGTWQPVDVTPAATTRPATQPVSAPELDAAEALLYHGGLADKAKAMLLGWEKRNKDSPARDRCVWLLAESDFQLDDRISAFYYLDELMDKYPESRWYASALQKQYDIADDFLSGHKTKALGLAIFSAVDEGIEMLFRIQQRSPGSALAEKSLLRTADYYYSDSEFDLASDAYGAFERDFPRSPSIPRVRLRRAYSALAQFRGVKFDATEIVDARAQLVEIQRDYPELAREENVANVIDRIDIDCARKILLTAEYYERVHDPAGAAYHYRYLIETYPNSPEAETAEKNLSRLPASARAGPKPPPGNGYAPSTEPSERQP